MIENTYKKILEAQGNYVINVEGVDWFEYQGFMMPAYLPHCVPEISENIAKQVLKISAKYLVRWDMKFNQIEESQWWYILKRGEWDINDIKDKKKRWMIRQGKENFKVRCLSFSEVVNSCPAVTKAAIARYEGKSGIETYGILKKRVDSANKVPGVLEYIGCFREGKLVSFCENYIQENAVWMSTIRHDPEYLNKYSSYGLMDGILNYYLNEKKFDYVLDGSRSVHHKTQFQEHLIKVFGFTREYANLNVVYSPLLGSLVKLTYPFRNFFWKLAEHSNNKILNNVSAVLKQEHIKRSCVH